MDNQQLLDIIKQQLQQGVSRETITSNLISQGWQQSDINDAFSVNTNNRNTRQMNLFSGYLKTAFYVSIAVYILYLIRFIINNNLPSIVPPSSTDSLKYLSLFFFIPISAIIGFLFSVILVPAFGLFYRKKSFEVDSLVLIKKKPRNILITFFVCGLIILIPLIIQDANSQKVFNTQNTKGIKFDTGTVKKINIDNQNKIKYDLSLNQNHAIDVDEGFKNKIEEFTWNNNKFSISFSFYDANIMVKPIEKGPTINHSLRGYPYITTLSYLPFDFGSKSYLFLLADLRATSNLSVISVFDGEGNLLYEELLDDTNILEIGTYSNGEQVIITGAKIEVYQKPSELYLNNFGYKIQ